MNLERIGKGDQSKVPPSQVRKQAKRYQALSWKIDDLCKRVVTHSKLTASFFAALCFYIMYFILK
ncbi:hypothetical protein ACSBR1_041090 [Camellia fascicularis]